MKAKKLLALSIGCVCASSHALTVNDFIYESGTTNSNYTSKGKPNNTYSVSNSLPNDTLSNVYSMLPEGTYVNSDFIAPERYTNIDIDNELNGQAFATASVTFLNEGAGYRNSLGYFVYDTNNPPSSIDDIAEHRIIFPNASKPGAGNMKEGDTIDLNVQLTPGQSLGFFIVPNGWGWGWRRESRGDLYYNVKSLGEFDTPFYTLSSLNPEATAELRRHNVTFIDTENEFLVLGFEDIQRPGGDNDFNDLIFTVNITPFSAIDGVNPDGSTDSKYEPLVQNNNPDITITSVYPGSNTFATMAFEDRWPLMGDYDFNDVVWRYRVIEQLNGQRELKSITFDYNLQAMGAGYSNGFAIKLPNVDSSNIDSTILRKNGQVIESEILQAGSETVLTVVEDLRAELNLLSVLSTECTYYRTQTDCVSLQAADILGYQLEVTFKQPVSRDLIGYPPYDSFIFASKDKYHGDFVTTPPGMSWQTHFKSFPGTSLMNNSLFNSFDDDTGGTEFFITYQNMPWAINIRNEWAHPSENTDISHAYPQFPVWVSSNGESSANWYDLPEAGKTISAD